MFLNVITIKLYYYTLLLLSLLLLNTKHNVHESPQDCNSQGFPCLRPEEDSGTQLAEPHRLRRRSVERLNAVGSCVTLLAQLFLLRPAACFRTKLDDLVNRSQDILRHGSLLPERFSFVRHSVLQNLLTRVRMFALDCPGFLNFGVKFVVASHTTVSVTLC